MIVRELRRELVLTHSSSRMDSHPIEGRVQGLPHGLHQGGRKLRSINAKGACARHPDSVRRLMLSVYDDVIRSEEDGCASHDFSLLTLRLRQKQNVRCK